MLKEGLYEQVINKAIDTELSDTEKISKTACIDSAEASKVLSSYVADVVEKALENLKDSGKKINSQINLVNSIVNTIINETDEQELTQLSVSERAEQLMAIYNNQDNRFALNEDASEIRPETSIAQSSLFTGAVHEPQMFSELKKEILSSDHIDMLVSFIKWSGLRLIIDELTEFTRKGGVLRIITTSYMGATDVKAVDVLSKLPNTKIKVSYDTRITRLHAKAYVFYRDTGFTTAYVGSSNLSNAAMSSGLEWNVKVTRKDLPQTIDKIEATFESYWNSGEFEYYDEGQKERLSRALKAEKYFDNNNAEMYTVDVKPYAFQQEILDKLDAERNVRGYHKNLVVAATGTGKTVISALDYKRFKKNNPDKPCRLLFVAHREEILKQSRATFRAVLKDANFGELFVGNYRPGNLDYLFISIQTFKSKDFTKLTSPDYYDFIVVDEFHHAAAPSYEALLEHYNPSVLLGLTATPERMDGKSILPFFSNRIAAEIRLPEAIDRKLLCPFQYFGVTDSVDLTDIKWSAGGYDKRELSNVYTMAGFVAERRADLIVDSVLKYVTDIDEVKGIGFCVTIEHAMFMSRYFNDHRIPSMYLTSQSTDEDRAHAKNRLVSGAIRFIFVVDIYNEGVDIPEVNTVLFLRPTESLTIFLQQLGRGLRLSDNKDCLTVLDFVGQANKKYNFEDKFKALLYNTTRGVTREIKDGFVSLPKGCYIQLEKTASKYILENIRASYGNTAGMISRIATFEEDTGRTLSLSNYLDYFRLDPRAMYRYESFSRMCARADVIENFEEPAEERLKKAMLRLSIADSRRWIRFLLKTLPILRTVKIDELSKLEQRMMHMFYYTVFLKSADDWNSDEVRENIKLLLDSPIMMDEVIQLLNYRYEAIDFVDTRVDIGFDSPLDLYCTYTRDQILVAMDYMDPSNVREGTKWLGDKKLDVFFITLNKAEKDYSPTTMYKDYSINSELFHWQSQSTTSDTSPTGQRYIHHKEQGSKVLLFVREFKTDHVSGGAEAYTFLGTANYQSHKGSRPMSITWKLDNPIPAKYLRKTNKLLVG